MLRVEWPKRGKEESVVLLRSDQNKNRVERTERGGCAEEKSIVG